MENKNILIIDDDPAMIKLFELIARKSGFNVVSATNGTEGLRKLNQQDFILVITDLKMPFMNGIEFIKQARKIPKFMNFPFVIVTGNFQEFSAEVVLLKDLTIMEKPIKQKDLQELLNNAISIPPEKEELKIPIEEIQEFIIQKLQSISSIMLEIITKNKPEINTLKKIPIESFFGGYYYIGHLLTFEKENIAIIFNFDLGISKNIVEELAKGMESKPEVVLECLGKVVISMMKKIPENSPYLNIFPLSKTLFLVGNGEGKNIFGTLQDNFVANIIAKNTKGSLIIHIIKV